jgi:hypothetical protein
MHTHPYTLEQPAADHRRELINMATRTRAVRAARVGGAAASRRGRRRWLRLWPLDRPEPASLATGEVRPSLSATRT